MQKKNEIKREKGRLVCLSVLKQMSKKRSSRKLPGGEKDGEAEFEWVSIIAYCIFLLSLLLA